MPALRIKFSGLCTFVFNHSLKKEGSQPTEVTVLLQRLIRARPLPRVLGAKPETLDQHFPLLDFNLADYDLSASRRRADFHCIPGADGQMTRGTCLLIGEDLTILPDGNEMERHALALSNAEPKEPSSPRLTRQERDSLWWMATLEDVFRDKSAINPEILDTPPGANQPILARVTLTEGLLRTLELTDAACVIVPPLEHRDSERPFNQRVATAFELSVPFINSVTIKSSAHRKGKTTESELVFRPTGGEM